jgi:hypothetical protein
MFERIANGFSLARSSWQVLMSDKKLLVFPLVSGILWLLVLATFAVPMYMLFEHGRLLGPDHKLRIWAYPIIFAFYFCSYFVVIFCNAALVSCALLKFNGETATLGDGFRAAMARHRQILGWALVSASVGLLLKALESFNKRGGEIIARFIGAAWSIMTYFVVPILVVEKVGPFQAIKESTSLLRKTWGEALVGKAGLGIFFFLLLLPIAGIFALGYFMHAQDPTVGIALFAVGGACVMIYAIVTSAMSTIFLTAIYQFAAFGRIPVGFEPNTLTHAFASKLKK